MDGAVAGARMIPLPEGGLKVGTAEGTTVESRRPEQDT